MKTVGTREAKDIIYMNDGIRIGSVVCRVYRNGYVITDSSKVIMKTSKINLALDKMVDMGLLEETRFRLTSRQKDVIRQRIWEFIGCTIMYGLSFSIALILAVAWFIG